MSKLEVISIVSIILFFIIKEVLQFLKMRRIMKTWDRIDSFEKLFRTGAASNEK